MVLLLHPNKRLQKNSFKFFEGLYGTDVGCQPIEQSILNQGPLLSHECAQQLISPISDSEIHDALFNIGDDKSPGPDGYFSFFFKSAWSIVGDLFCSAVREFFSSSALLMQWNRIAIALVPKLDRASSVNDYRPIAYCNVFYKVISKILASKLAITLDSLVDHAQSTFVGSRNITDNIHLAQEFLRQYNIKRISPRCLIEVDIRKAYDSVSWSFLSAVLIGLGYLILFVHWILECVSSTTFSYHSQWQSFWIFQRKERFEIRGPHISISICPLLRIFL